ncbi:MAG: glutamate--tRNA ligase [candidate division Zixibacteria bacterium]|nr:glutamate--tRNA ligase [candidate division Zixibacteria bacterium]
MTNREVTVRIAPSPTGYLHVGTGRTAIFNYLFAKKHAGKFRIRIEDTDVERSDASLVEPILNALRWLGCEWDGEVIYQSRRFDLYRQYVEKLLESGHGYRCFCTPAELEAERNLAMAEKRAPKYSRKCLRMSQDEVRKRVERGDKFAIRLRIPDGETSYDDMVLGLLTRKNEDLEDFVAARSDGTPTYNFAVVIDDHDMEITHIVRGNDHVTNTFKQIHLYHAFGWDVPRFGHTPLILRPDKQKVSKRLGDKDVAAYQKEGILPEAMFNYLCMLGWSPKNDREIYSTQELIDIFDSANFNPSNAVFDEEKLVSFNKAHIMKKSDHDLAVLVAPMLVDAGLTTKYWLETRWEYLRMVISLLKERVRRVTDFVSLGGYFFFFDYSYDSNAEAEQFTPEAAELLSVLAERFASLTEFSHASTEAALTGLAEERGVKKAKLIHPTRLAVSGITVGPGLYDLLVALTQPVVVERMKKAVDSIRARHKL